MNNLRLPFAMKMVVALAAILVANLGLLQAQGLEKNVDAVRMGPAPVIPDRPNDTWEPNDSAAVVQPSATGTIVAPGPVFCPHFSPNDIMGNVWRAQNGATTTWTAFTNDQLWLTPGDEDWFLMIYVPNGTLHMAMHQMSDIGNRIAVEIYLAVPGGSPTLVAGPQMPAPFYREYSTTNNPPDPYDGVVLDVPINAADIFLVRFFEKSGNGSFPAGAKVKYEFSYETTWTTSIRNPNGDPLDAFEGALPNPSTNNFFLDCAADITPPGGAANYTCSYTGYDYYKVNLTTPSSISLNVSATPTTGQLDAVTQALTVRFNYDLLPIADGANKGVIKNAFNQTQIEFEGASDTWNTATGAFTRVGAPQSSMTVNTPVLASGTYYFLVMCWDTFILPGNVNGNIMRRPFANPNNWVGYFPVIGGDPPNYTLNVTVTPGADDQYDIAPNNNDTAATASLLLPGYYPNLRLFWGATLGEQDWYKVNLNDGDTLEVRLDVNVAALPMDDFTLELYRPATTPTPGIPADMVDRSAADQAGNKRMPFKNPSGQLSGRVGYETVGTWGTVGLVGNTRLPAGMYLIRVTVGPVGDVYSDVIPTTGAYALTIYVNGTADGVINPFLAPISTAPEDTREPNDNLAEARTNSGTIGLDGLNRNLRAMDFQDWIKIPVAKNDTIEATLIYNAVAPTVVSPQVTVPGVDLDILLYDMHKDEPFDINGVQTLITVCPYIGGRLDVEAPGQQRVTVTAVAGQGYNPTPVIGGRQIQSPSNGDMYIVIQRWGCRGAQYDLNININGRGPISALQLTAVRTGAPQQIDAGLNQFVDVEVDVTNVLSTQEQLNGIAFNLMHEKGADVTGQYAITGPNAPGPGLPAVILPGITMTFVYRIQGNPLSTNGVVSVFPDGIAGNKSVPGLPYDDYTTVNGNEPGPRFLYSLIRAAPGSNLKPGGALILEVVVSNADGTTAGMLTQPDEIVFTRSGLDVSTEYTLSTNSPVVAGVANGLPTMLTVGQDVTVEWIYGISHGATEGTVLVTLTGGGPANPEASAGSFEVSTGYGQAFIGGSSGCAQGDHTAPWMLLGVLALVGLAGLRRRKAA